MLVTAVALVVLPLAVGARPASPVEVPAGELARRVQASGAVGWSGFVQTSGGLQVPASDSFATVGQLLGERNDLRVWWRTAEDWRVDRIRSTGETDLFRSGDGLVRWVFESERATYSLVSTVRLPEAYDLLPPTLGRSLLQGVRPAELSSLPARRVAGVTGAGLRLTPDDPASSIARVDLWADPDTGLALRIELYGAGDSQPVLTTTLLELKRRTPEVSTTRFQPGAGVNLFYEESVDVVAAANAFAPFDLPASVAGLPTRDGQDPAAAGIYGRGPTTMLVLPLRGQVARPLRDRLRDSSEAQETRIGVWAPVGPVGIVMTRFRGRPGDGGFLLAGTVTRATLERAATDLLAST